MKAANHTSPIRLSALRSLTPADLAGDPVETARWLHAAARYGMVEAQTALGQILLDGRGVAQDRAAACQWFGIAAGAGHVPAINMLGRCCELGWGTVADHSRAAGCYRRAAAAGLDWGQYNLANMTLRGRGTPRDRALALRLYKLAAAQGHAKSMNMVGRFLEEGWVTPVAPEAAAAWYYRAAEAGDFRGQYNLASMLTIHGRIAEAVTWLLRAIDIAPPDFLRLMAARLKGNNDENLRTIGEQARQKARQGQGSALDPLKGDP